MYTFPHTKKNHALCCRIQVSNVSSLQHPSCWERHSAFYFYVVCYKNNASLSRTILWTKKLLTHEFSYSSFSLLQKGVNWSKDTVVQKNLIFADKKENNEKWQIQLSKHSPNGAFRFELIKYEKLLPICVAFIFLRLVLNFSLRNESYLKLVVTRFFQRTSIIILEKLGKLCIKLDMAMYCIS